MSAAVALDIAERCAAVAVLLSVVELFVARGQLDAGGTLDWRVLSLRRPANALDRLIMHRVAFPLLDRPGVLWLAALELAAATAMFVFPRLIAGPLVCLALHLVLSRRHLQATDGSDDMLVVLLGAGVARGVDSAGALQSAVAVFVCAQACLAYLTSGLSKAQARVWWDGTGLRGTLCTLAYGHPVVTRVVCERELVTRIAGPATIAWETLFVLAVLAGPLPTLVALGVAGLFHLTCAYVMGLASFVWTFPATFPAIYVTSTLLASSVSIADRAVLVALVGSGLVAAAVGLSRSRATAR
jgi:hypothetical protein